MNPHSDLESDEVLLARFRLGHDAALAPLFERHESAIFRFLFAMLKDHHDAEDATQETFLQAIRHADVVEPGKFRGWLFTVAHQQAMLQKRREKDRFTISDEMTLLGLTCRTEDSLERSDDITRVKRLLEQLPEPQRAVIKARVFEGKKFRDVAAALGCPLNTALARMHAGLKTLRTLWEANYA